MITLNMIVKNEAHCIRRCLESVLPYIDDAVIVDTGSTDGTQELISGILCDKQHVVIERPWVNFGYNRTEALHLAKKNTQYKASWALLIDADEQLVVDSLSYGAKLRPVHVAYYAWHHMPGGQYARPFLLSLNRDWTWEGVLHEHIVQKHEYPLIPFLHIKDHFDSNRNKQGQVAKCLADAELLQTQQLTARNVFYIAESYRGAQQWELALDWYRNRCSFEAGCPQEHWWSELMLASCMDKLDYSFERVRKQYLNACWYRPSRAESYIALSRYLWKHGGQDASRQAFDKAMKLPMTADTMNVDTSCYNKAVR